MTKMSSRQVYFFLGAIAPVGKLVLMPPALVHIAKNDLLLPTLMNMLLQTGVIFSVMLVARANKTFYQLLENTFGKIAAKILVTLFALFLFYASVVPLLEQRLLVQSVFYDTIPSVVVYAPFFVFSAYLCARPLMSMGRIWDIIAPISIISFIGIMALSTGKADFGALMPVGASGAKGIFGGAAYTMAWFFDSALVLMFMGKFEYQKGMAWKSAVCYLLGAAAVLFFLSVYYGIFSDIAVRQTFAFSKISKYFSASTVLGRIDYIFIYGSSLVMAFYSSLPLHAAVECFNEAYGCSKRKTAFYSLAFNFAAFLISLIFGFLNRTVNSTVTQDLFWIFPVFCVLVPVACLFLRRNAREKV